MTATTGRAGDQACSAARRQEVRTVAGGLIWRCEDSGRASRTSGVERARVWACAAAAVAERRTALRVVQQVSGARQDGGRRACLVGAGDCGYRQRTANRDLLFGALCCVRQVSAPGCSVAACNHNNLGVRRG